MAARVGRCGAIWSYPEVVRYGFPMPTGSAEPRARGEIETLPSGSLRVRVYAGVDPASKKRQYLVQTVPAGADAAAEADRVRARLLEEVAERRSSRRRPSPTRDTGPA